MDYYNNIIKKQGFDYMKEINYLMLIIMFLLLATIVFTPALGMNLKILMGSILIVILLISFIINKLISKDDKNV